MRRLMHALTAACLILPASASAELQWQTSGVRQVSHEASAAPKRSRPAAKRPTVVRQAAAERAASPEPVQRAVLSADRPVQSAGVHRDAAVQPACDSCDSHVAEGYVLEGGPSCGVDGCGCGVEPGCGFEPGCGVLAEPSCGCGQVGCGGACGEAVCGCGDVCHGGCGGVPVTFILPPIRELTFETGVQAFKNPLDAGRDRGNFGANVGVNLGGTMSWLGVPALGYQIGYRATFSQLHGDSQLNTADGHTQNFFTAGLFRRRAVGLQYGVVYDFLSDERQGTQDFGQLRGLISVTNPRGHEIGFQFATHLNDNVVGTPNVSTLYQATDQYLAFYRMHACTGGEFRVFGGFDSDDKGILGGDLSLPLTDRWSLNTGFTYLIPEQDPGADEEAWNLGMNLVWHYGCRARQSFNSQYRPMFRVADNGSFIIDDQP